MNHLANSWMSTIWSALLLLVLGFQWISGYWVVGSAYVVAKKKAMTALEVSIAEDLRQQFGLRAAVQVEEQSRLRIVQGMGYGTTFYFTQERNNEKVFFAVVPTDTATIHFATPPTERENDHPLRPLEMRQWFSDYCFEYSSLNLQLPTARSLTYPTKIPLFSVHLPVEPCSAVPTPPPQELS